MKDLVGGIQSDVGVVQLVEYEGRVDETLLQFRLAEEHLFKPCVETEDFSVDFEKRFFLDVFVGVEEEPFQGNAMFIEELSEFLVGKLFLLDFADVGNLNRREVLLNLVPIFLLDF